MKELTKKQFIKDQKYYIQLPLFVLFGIIGFTVPIIELISATNSNPESLLFNTMCTFFFVCIPFGGFMGCYLGVYHSINIIRKLRWIQTGKIKICEKRIVDKMKLHWDSSDRYCQLLFSDTDGIWVSEKTFKEIKLHDTCWVFYLNDNTHPCAIYSKRKTKLATDLRPYFKAAE